MIVPSPNCSPHGFLPVFAGCRQRNPLTRIDPYEIPVFDWCSGHGFEDRFFRRIRFECLELILHQLEILVFRFVGQGRGTILQLIGIIFLRSFPGRQMPAPSSSSVRIVSASGKPVLSMELCANEFFTLFFLA